MYLEVDDKRVFAATAGEPFDNSKPVVLLLSGSGLDHTFWSAYSGFFAQQGYAVLVPNLPAHTNSKGPALTSIEAMADWLNDLIESLGADNISLLGHSQGCLISLELASRYPERFRSVSLIASGLSTPVNPDLIAAAEKNPQAAVDMMLSWSFSKESAAGNSMAAVAWSTMSRDAPEALLSDLKACDVYENGQAATAKITCPQQVILAADDRMAPRKAGMQLVEHLSDPELHVIDDCGHMVLLEAEQECRSLLGDFISACNPGY